MCYTGRCTHEDYSGNCTLPYGEYDCPTEEEYAMNRVVVTNCFVNLTTMQVCAVKDATDEEILDVCNSLNSSGTSAGWSEVIRSGENSPVVCAEDKDRLHILVVC